MSSNDKAAGDSSDLLRAAELLAQIGEELAFVVPDGDAGLLPINRFVMDLEEWVAPAAAGPWTAGLKLVRRWLDEILDGSGKFSEGHIRLINDWHAYLSSVLDALLDGGGMPDWPSGWDRSLVPDATTPVAGVPEPAADSISPQPPAPGPSPSAVPEPIGDEPSIRLNLDEDLELLREFHAESLELLQGIEQGVLVLETTPANTETINSIFRAFHTFKGGAGFLHLDAPRHLAHELETLLDLVRRSELRINAGIINLILAGADALRQFTHAIGAQLQGIHPGALIVVPTSDIIRRAKSAARGESVPPPVPAPSAPAPAPVVVQPAPSTPIAGFPKSDRTSLETVPQAAPEAKAPLSPAAPAREPVSGDPVAGFVKLDTAKLDSLVDLVGELVVAQSMVVQNQEVRSIESPQFVRLVRQLSRITGDLQRTAMSMRMVPIRGAFQKMTRLVRDLAASQHKQVQLLLEGEETELDRNIVEKLGDPLIHMIRNSLDHGIEVPADRIAQGKPAQGTIRLSAAHQRGGIVIRITDDGKGLNPGRIRAKALERGLIRADAELDESEIFSLIFLPGFSTAERVTDLSGRGVGMDVVRRNIEGLRGKIEIQSVPGQGAQFTIVLPLTLAIIDGMLVGVGEDRYIIPTLSIRESFRPQPGMVSTIQGCGEVVSVRGRQTPLLRLGRHLDRPFKASNPEDAIIVVVESGDASRGLLVDELLGKQEVVIKSLGQAFQNQSLLAGSAVLGDGSVGLILDVDTLVKAPGHRKISATATATPGP